MIFSFDSKVELVVMDREHNYERFKPMNKTGQTVDPGRQEIVVCTGGVSHYGFGTILPANRASNANTYGVLNLTRSSGSYSWKFIPIVGSSYTDSGSRNF